MKNLYSILLLGVVLMLFVTSCGGSKSTKVDIDEESIVSISISNYPTIFANGDSIDATTDAGRIQEIVTAFSEATLKYYKTKEEWDQISPAADGKDQATITFYNSEREDVFHVTRVKNAEGTFIMQVIENDVYIVPEKDSEPLNNIFNTLIDEAKAGRLNN